MGRPPVVPPATRFGTPGALASEVEAPSGPQTGQEKASEVRRVAREASARANASNKGQSLAGTAAAAETAGAAQEDSAQEDSALDKARKAAEVIRTRLGRSAMPSGSIADEEEIQEQLERIRILRKEWDMEEAAPAQQQAVASSAASDPRWRQRPSCSRSLARGRVCRRSRGCSRSRSRSRSRIRSRSRSYFFTEHRGNSGRHGGQERHRRWADYHAQARQCNLSEDKVGQGPKQEGATQDQASLQTKVNRLLGGLM